MTNITKIDSKISELKSLEDQIDQLSKAKEEKRTELFEIIEKENLEQYKNDSATVSYVTRQSVKIKDSEKLINDLKEQKLVKFLEVIPEHVELNKTFDKEVKEGLFTHPEVEITENKNLAIRFVK